MIVLSLRLGSWNRKSLLTAHSKKMVLAVKRNTLSVDKGKPCCWTGVIFVTAGIGQTQEKANWPILILRSKEPVPAKLTFMGPLGNLFMNINLFPGM